MPISVQRDEQPSINLTPMIDIVFLLIIFFMVGTRFSELTEAERNIELNVPEVAHASPLIPPPQRRFVNVFENGSLTLDEQPVTLGQLREQLTESLRQYPGTGVTVRGDAAAIYQGVADVLAVCRAAGVTDLGISVRVASRE